MTVEQITDKIKSLMKKATPGVLAELRSKVTAKRTKKVAKRRALKKAKA